MFARSPRHIVDVGGNTGAWALACAAYDPSVRMTLVDLPEQIAAARALLRGSPHRDRIELWAADVLDESQPLPGGADTVWMSQFLDCFAEEQIERILARVSRVLPDDGVLFVLELFSDRQRHEAAAYSLNATSLYFTCIANGVSRMYRADDFVRMLAAAGFEVAAAARRSRAWAYAVALHETTMSARNAALAALGCLAAATASAAPDARTLVEKLAREAPSSVAFTEARLLEVAAPAARGVGRAHLSRRRAASIAE